MPRQYSQSVGPTAIGSAVEILSMYLASGTGLIRLKKLTIQEADSSIAGPQDLMIKIQRLYGVSVVPGGGGSGGSGVRKDRGDNASFTTAAFWNTSLSTGSHTDVLKHRSEYIYQGIELTFDDPLIITGTDLIQVLFDSAPTGSPDFVVSADWEEEGI